MSNRSLVEYFSPTSTANKRNDPLSSNHVSEVISPIAEKAVGRRQKKSKAPAQADIHDDFEDDVILPAQNGNSITKYFSPVDKTQSLKKSNSLKVSKLTVQVQVHGSPKKLETPPVTAKRLLKKKARKKLGLPCSQADKIEVVSSELIQPCPQLIESCPSTPITEEPASVVKPESVAPVQIKKQKRQSKAPITENNNVGISEETEADDVVEGPRRSARVRSRPATVQAPEEPEDEPIAKRGGKKRRKKEQTNVDSVDKSDSDIEIVTDKVAPIFLKRKHHDEYQITKKAKQDFLFSGVPEVVKQRVAIQQALENRPVDIFPRVSHVTQAGLRPWCLPYPTSLESVLRRGPPAPVLQPVMFSNCLNTAASSEVNAHSGPAVIQAAGMDWRYCKDWISQLKEDYGLSFPLFRTLRNLLSKSSKSDGSTLWTDTYAPTSAADLLPTNKQSSQQLKSWLNQWKLKAGEAIEPEPRKPRTGNNLGKRKRLDSDYSDKEQIIADEKSCGSWNSEESLCNCLLLVGPCGSGKTASVYALAEELGFNVLEVNASSRRNGKTVLSHLQEATQSHSLHNASGTAASGGGIGKFFGSAKPTPTAKPEEPKGTQGSLSLVLFEDVDIVFEAEDESFYSALNTLLQTSKRPVILTLGSTEVRALEVIQEKVKSDFDILHFNAPDWTSACGYLWSVSLAEGYPLGWKALADWVGGRLNGLDLDLRSLLHDLQFQLEHHPLRLRLNFSQLQLKNEDESPNIGRRSATPVEANDAAATIHHIDLPTPVRHHDWPFTVEIKPPSFVYDSNEAAVVLSGTRKKFSRILSNDQFTDTDSKESVENVSAKSEKWRGDLAPLALSLESRACQDLLHSFRSSQDLSWNESSLLCDIEEFLSDRGSRLMEKEIGEARRETIQEQISRTTKEQLVASAHQTMLLSTVTRVSCLQRSSHSSDVLPYVRSMCRSDIVRSVGKRRRKPPRTSEPTTRLPSFDLMLPTSAVLQLTNSFY